MLLITDSVYVWTEDVDLLQTIVENDSTTSVKVLEIGEIGAIPSGKLYCPVVLQSNSIQDIANLFQEVGRRKQVAHSIANPF